MGSNLPFDDWTEADGPLWGEQPGEIVGASWFEVEAGGPGLINRIASVAGILVTSIGDLRNIGDGTITLNTGYNLNPKTDQWESLIEGQGGPLVSCFVELSSIEAQDDALADEMPRSGWLESVDADLRSVGNQLGLFLTIKANLDGDIAFERIGYQVILLFGSTRPPAIMPVGIAPGSGAHPIKRHPDKSVGPPSGSDAVKTKREKPSAKKISRAVRGKAARKSRPGA